MDYDLVVIGGGPGGYEAALHAVKHGIKTALIEANRLGGTCLNVGCVPTKALLHAAHLVEDFCDASLFGVDASDVSFNLSEVYERKDSVVDNLRTGLQKLLSSKKIDLYTGVAKIEDNNTVSVKTSEDTILIKTKYILIATGSKSSMPPIKGIDSEGVTSSDTLILEAPNFKSLIIIGGGVIGVELASVFASFGVAVTVVEGLTRLLPLMDREISTNLTMIFKKRNIGVVTDARVEGIVRDGNILKCSYSKGDISQTIEAEHILVATGRIPYFTNLFDDAIGIESKRGILVDGCFKTSIDNIYAIGDVVEGNIQLAHVASAQGISAVSHMFGLHLTKTDYINIPSCIYTKPEIASVGLTLEAAKQLDIPCKALKYIMGANARTLIENSDRGFIKLIVRDEDKVIVGAHLMCERASDIIGELAIAVSKGLTTEDIQSVVHAHPTFYEGIFLATQE